MNIAIERTNVLNKLKTSVLINPKYLTNLNKIEEEKILGQRTIFLEFHKYIYALSKDEVDKLFLAFKQFTTKARKVIGSLAFNDYEIINSTIRFHVCLRNEEGLYHDLCSAFAADYLFERDSAEDFPEVTSKHLIKLTEDIIKNHTGEKELEFA